MLYLKCVRFTLAVHWCLPFHPSSLPCLFILPSPSILLPNLLSLLHSLSPNPIPAGLLPCEQLLLPDLPPKCDLPLEHFPGDWLLCSSQDTQRGVLHGVGCQRFTQWKRGTPERDGEPDGYWWLVSGSRLKTKYWSFDVSWTWVHCSVWVTWWGRDGRKYMYCVSVSGAGRCISSTQLCVSYQCSHVSPCHSVHAHPLQVCMAEWWIRPLLCTRHSSTSPRWNGCWSSPSCKKALMYVTTVCC